MVLKFYSYAQSSNARRVLVVLKELGLSYETVNVDIFQGAQFNPEFKAFQPFAKVPCIDDDGFKLYESRAIARYLAAKYKSPLLPTEPKAAALFEQAASIENSHFSPPAQKIQYEKFVKPFFKQEPNEEAIKECVDSLKKALDVYEQILSKTKYLAGDELTLADLFHIPLGAVLPDRLGFNLLIDPSRPNVTRWWNDISNRPSWLASTLPA